MALKGCIYIINYYVISPTCNIYYKSKEKRNDYLVVLIKSMIIPILDCLKQIGKLKQEMTSDCSMLGAAIKTLQDTVCWNTCESKICLL